MLLIGALLIAGATIVASAHAATGDLAGQGCISDVGDPAGCGTTQQGLNDASGVAVSPDGKSVYVASSGTEDAIVRFDRNTTTGALTPQDCIADVGDPAGCGTTEPGLGSASGVAVSADGKSVYVAADGDAIVRFDRNTITGALTGQGCISDVGDPPGCGTTQHGLAGASDVAVSADGKSVYVVSGGLDNDQAIVRFDRNTTTGALTPQGCISDVEFAVTIGCGPTQQGLDGASDVAVSADGKSVYVASFTDDAIVRFDRNTTTGALTGQGCITDDPGPPPGCGPTQKQQGLDGAGGVALSADGESVYVASFWDESALVRFDRDTTTGALTPQGCVSDVGDPAGCGTTEQGLGGASGVALSADGESVYVASGFLEDAIVHFDRAPAPDTPPPDPDPDPPVVADTTAPAGSLGTGNESRVAPRDFATAVFDGVNLRIRLKCPARFKPSCQGGAVAVTAEDHCNNRKAPRAHANRTRRCVRGKPLSSFATAKQKPRRWKVVKLRVKPPYRAEVARMARRPNKKLLVVKQTLRAERFKRGRPQIVFHKYRVRSAG